MRICTFDCEIKEEVDGTEAGWERCKQGANGLSCCVVYDSESKRPHVYGQYNVVECISHLNYADLCVSYNGIGFDIPLLSALSGGVVSSTQYDLLADIWAAVPEIRGLHGAWGLDGVCLRTLGRGKARGSIGVPQLWKDGRASEVIEHCINDVMLTWDLYNFIKTYGYIIGPDKEAVHLAGEPSVNSGSLSKP